MVSSRSSFVRAIKPELFPGPRTNTPDHSARRWSPPYGEAVQSNARFRRLRWRLPAPPPVPGLGEPADQPIRLDRIVHPGCGPALGDAGFDSLPRHFAAVAVEERQLSARLRQPALEITPLRLARTSGRRDASGQSLPHVDFVAFLFLRFPT